MSAAIYVGVALGGLTLGFALRGGIELVRRRRPGRVRRLEGPLATREEE